MIRANIQKTVSYLKRNGIKSTMLAVTERLQRMKKEKYTFVPVSEEDLKKQRERVFENPVVFSVVVPVYHTPENFYKEMIESVLNQSYPHFELILADAGKQQELKSIAESYRDERIKYVQLEKNIGIAENTNQALMYATGDYVALLDHDDVYTLDALYEMASAIEEGKKRGVEIGLLYSDEDKCDETGKIFYEPNRKPSFDLDLLMTNNYICHLLVMKTELMKNLKERPEYDGAQDHDLVLRGAAALLYGVNEAGDIDKTALPNVNYDTMPIVSIPKVLYHWRCHLQSTAANPESKRYAYDAGTRAIADLVKYMGWKGNVSMMEHVGFSRIEYEGNIFLMRPEICMVGGKILNKAGRIVAGRMDSEGKVLNKGLPSGFTGYLNRAILYQRAEALDIRGIKLNPKYHTIYREVIGEEYREDEATELCIPPKYEKDSDYIKMSLLLSKRLFKEGLLLWDPAMEIHI